MEIIIGKNAGLCPIAQKVIDKAIESTKNGPVYCIGKIVHNKNVIEKLTKAGVCIINKIEESKGYTIIGAHGIIKDEYIKAKEMNIDFIDYTCPNVLSVRKIVEEYLKNEYYIIFTGKKNHAEVLAIKNIADNKCIDIEKIEEIPKVLNIINDKKRLLLLSQTTFNTNRFYEIAEELQKNLKSDIKFEIKNTICSITENRQKEAREMAKIVDAMIIVGDRNSYNSTELYNISRQFCSNTQFVCNSEELDLSLFRKNYKIGIMAGASTPKEDILMVKKLLLTSDKIIY